MYTHTIYNIVSSNLTNDLHTDTINIYHTTPTNTLTIT